MRAHIILPVLAALGLAACTVNTAPANPGYVAVPTPPPTIITTQPAAPAAVLLR